MSATDVEIDRVLNAINVTLNDQRPDNPPRERLQEIADGATAQERRLEVRAEAAGRFVLHDADTREVVARVERAGAGRWTVQREREAQGSHVAQPGESG